MSIIKIPAERKELFTLTTHPDTIYVSGGVGSNSEITGAMPLRARSSERIREFLGWKAAIELSDSWLADPTVRPYTATDFRLIECLLKGFSVERRADIRFKSLSIFFTNVY